MKKILAGFVLMFVLLPVSVSAVDYYVDVNSIGGSCSDSNNGMSVSSPWCTITRANSVLQAGDTVYIRQGIYSENDQNTIINPRNPGSAGNPITYTNYGNDAVYIRGQNTLAIINQNYITLDGLRFEEATQEIDGPHFGIDIIGKDHIIVKNCIIRNLSKNTDGSAIMGIRLREGSEYCQILNNTISHIGPPDGVDRGNGDGIQTQGDGCKYNLIEGNELSYISHTPLSMWGFENVYRNNIVYNYWHRGGTLIGQPNDPAKGRNLFEGNYMHNCGHVNHNSAWHNPGLRCSGSGNIIRNNVFDGNLGPGLYMNGVTSSGQTYYNQDNKVYNNVFHGNGYDAIGGVGDTGIFMNENTGSDTQDGNVFKNNINYNNDGDGIDTYGDASTGDNTFTNNWWDANGNPVFQDESNSDFSLGSGSPCIDAGGWLTATRSAGSGTNIPVQDAGYFTDGFGIVEGDLIQLEGQSITARITNVNYDTNTLTVDRSLTWTSGQGVSLSYSGSAPDIGVYEFLSEEPPTPECGDGNCDSGEDCSSCPQDCSCSSPQICCSGVCSTPTCTQNSDCGSDPCKTYTCSNPGTCSSACSSQDKTSCLNDDGCCPPGCDQTNDNDCLPPGGPVAFWHFDEGSGDLASDGSGNGNDGTVNGANWTSGMSGSALSFDGINDYIDCGDASDLNAGIISVSLWIKPGIQEGNNIFLSKGAYHRSGWYLWHNSNGDMQLRVNNATSHENEFAASFFTFGEWQHVAVVFGKSKVYWYKNGVPFAPNPEGDISMNWTLPAGQDFVIGDYSTNPDEYNFNGTIDEVRIYDRALSPQEILNFYNELEEIARADVDSDGDVDIDDLIEISLDFGKKTGFDPVCDINSDGGIDIFDLVFVASRFT
ncbi:MAG: hypothetical protein GTN38_02550 [Candidatus Aenigmarchaeota archaeon]|nr:hypothetical protein [Candidatus Aenigmarchaeota archaeon]NIP40516.1 hypothetical protein [Candidatus Aenigmarchaeota archaeon]NIQ18361.1 hypothetical protein [Candidatus Aenigmarchaeota archaeon]